MFCTVCSGGLYGISAYVVQVEVDVATGLPCFGMVGSLGPEVREARERVQVALRNVGFDMPPMKITVNLSPAHVRKEGTLYDLPIAVGLMAALGYVPKEAVEGVFLAGELGLDGEIKPVRGIFPMVQESFKTGVKRCIVPVENVGEGMLVEGMEVRGADNIDQLVAYLRAGSEEQRELLLPRAKYLRRQAAENAQKAPDFSEVCGQEGAKRAAEIAAAGFHNLLMIGVPGAGKSMIASRIPGILPPLTTHEVMEVSAVYSVAGLLSGDSPLVQSRPFQSPHHTVTQAALTGGGSIPRPGILSLAHRGVLFLDELPEFRRSILDSLRQPLEEHMIQQARIYGNVTYPADFMLVCAMNPCSCGYYPDRNRCRCTNASIRRYLDKISGPILDRIDLCVEILPVDVKKLHGRGGESSADIRKRVMAARAMQEERFRGKEYQFNSAIPVSDMDNYCRMNERTRYTMEQAFERLKLSARGYHRTLRVARTIADLAGKEQIGEEELLEAICYRSADQAYWGIRGNGESV